MSTFGERLKLLRKSRNLTQQQIADLLFVNKSSVSRYESNSQLPETPQLQKLADYFEVSIDYLLGRNNESHVSLNSENKSNKNIDEIIEDFEISLDTATMPNGENMDEKSKELLRQNLKYIYELILSKNK